MIKRKYIIRIFIAVAVLGLFGFVGNNLYSNYLNQKDITISDEVVNFEMDKINKVSIEVTATKKSIQGKLVCNSTDFSIFYGGLYEVQILEDDGWHSILPKKDIGITEITETNKTMSNIQIKIDTQKILGGYLPKGTYRLVVYFGLNEQEVYTSSYKVIDTFEI